MTINLWLYTSQREVFVYLLHLNVMIQREKFQWALNIPGVDSSRLEKRSFENVNYLLGWTVLVTSRLSSSISFYEREITRRGIYPIRAISSRKKSIIPPVDCAQRKRESEDVYCKINTFNAELRYRACGIESRIWSRCDIEL